MRHRNYFFNIWVIFGKLAPVILNSGCLQLEWFVRTRQRNPLSNLSLWRNIWRWFTWLDHLRACSLRVYSVENFKSFDIFRDIHSLDLAPISCRRLWLLRIRDLVLSDFELFLELVIHFFHLHLEVLLVHLPFILRDPWVIRHDLVQKVVVVHDLL